MRLSLIGMSGCGKTHWSKEFAKHGFERFCCDDLITEKLAARPASRDGSAMELGKWMGFPYEPHYQDREGEYLAYEIDVLTEILEYLAGHNQNRGKNIIVDTTGSVVYTGDNLLERLRKNTTIVHLETPPQARELMLEKYLTNERPVLWKGLFSRNAGETNREALVRCYPALLSHRERQYIRHAHITIDYHIRNQDGFTIGDFLRLVKAG
jgi:shikimate kinase